MFQLSCDTEFEYHDSFEGLRQSKHTCAFFAGSLTWMLIIKRYYLIIIFVLQFKQTNYFVPIQFSVLFHCVLILVQQTNFCCIASNQMWDYLLFLNHDRLFQNKRSLMLLKMNCIILTKWSWSLDDLQPGRITSHIYDLPTVFPSGPLQMRR